MNPFTFLSAVFTLNIFFQIQAYGSISFAGGSIQTSEVAKHALQKSLAQIDCEALLAYGDSMGNEEFKQILAKMHGLELNSSQILVTSSAQQALNLIFETLLDGNRKVVLVQEPAFFGVFRILKQNPQIRVVPFRTAGDLLQNLKNERNAVVYLTSNFATPSGDSLSEDQKSQIASVLTQTGSVAIEDNPYDLLDYHHQAPSTLFSKVPDRVFFVGGLSKLVGPGLRIGYAFFPVEFYRQIKSSKISTDIFTATLNQAMAQAVLSQSGHIPSLRDEFKHKRDVALAELTRLFAEHPQVQWSRPEGGIFLQVQFPKGFDTEKLIRIANFKYDLKLESDRFYYLDEQTRHSLRINFVQNSEADLKIGLQLLAQAYSDMVAQPASNLKEVIVTSGGTVVPIDDVRKLGNDSQGTTGARIAEEFLRKGYRVHFVYSKNSRQPFSESLKTRPQAFADDASSQAELDRLRSAGEDAFRLSQNLVLHPYVTFDDYLDAVRSLCLTSNAEAIVLAAAVSDYGAAPTPGKIRSDADTIEIQLHRLPKVIDMVKQWNPQLFQVGFKLLAGQELKTAVDEAYQKGIHSHSNLTVLNVIQGGDLGQRSNVFITPEKGLLPAATQDVPRRLVEIVSQRVSAQHYKTVSVPQTLPLEIRAQLVQEFKTHVAAFWRLNLFEPYYEGADSYFGFFALRVPQGGFLITARGSNKKALDDDDIVYVPHVDFANRIVYAASSGKKASLNANVAAKIFADRPDTEMILHSHISLDLENKTQTDFAPSTEEDVQEIIAHLQNGQNSVELRDHGIILLGQTVEQITRQLNVQAAYFRFPHHYDAIYHRFHSSTDFLDFVQLNVGKSAAVLDMATGTGEVALALLRAGYSSLALADQSAGMMKVATGKIRAAGFQADIPTYLATFDDMNIQATFDAVVIRQAINYALTEDALLRLFQNIRKHLAPGGKLLFNAPHFTGAHVTYPDRINNYRYNGARVEIHEMNTLDRDGFLTHAQRAVIIQDDGSDIKKLYDLNRFRLFTPQDFERALIAAGFHSVSFRGKGQQPLSTSDKAVYIVAE